MIIVAGLASLWGFVIYPEIALGLDSPSKPTATAGDGEVSLAWQEPGLQLEVITGYRVYYSASKEGESSVDTGSIETSYTVTGLTNNTEYTFEITTLSDLSESERSLSVTATPTGGGGPDDPIALFGEPIVTTTATTAIIDWATTVKGTSVVEYGPTDDFKGEVTAGAAKTTDHSIEIQDLTSCAGYWFKVISYDDSSNLAESQGGDFKTTGCKGDSEIVTYQASVSTALAGTTISAKVRGKGLEAVVPANLKSGLSEVGVEALKLQKSLVQSEISTPSGKSWVGQAYSLKAFEDEKTELDEEFDAPVEITIDYTEEDIVGLDPNSLTIYHYTDGIGWEALNNCSTNTGAMTVTCETSSFSIFGLFGSESSQVQSSGSYPITNQTNQVVQKPESQTAPKAPAPTQAPTVNSSSKFEMNLALGQKSLEVKKLQMFLNSAGFKLAATGSGAPGSETEFFGPLTFAALVKFQEAYKTEILMPYGLVKGTGFFGEKTRAYINSMQ